MAKQIISYQNYGDENWRGVHKARINPRYIVQTTWLWWLNHEFFWVLGQQAYLVYSTGSGSIFPIGFRIRESVRALSSDVSEMKMR